MKKFLIFVIIFLSSSIFAYDFKEGVHYVKLDLPDEKGKVWMVYSVYCPFCEKYDSLVLPSIKLPEGVHIEDIYLDRMGKYGKSASEVLAAAYIKGGAAYQNAKQAFFIEILDNKEKNVRNENDFINLGLKAAGISRQEYIEALKSASVKDLVAHWGQISYKAASVRGVPSIVVNGNRLIIPASIESLEEMSSLVNFLLAK